MSLNLLLVVAVFAAGTMLRMRCSFTMLAAGACGIIAEMGFQRGTAILASQVQEGISNYVLISIAALALGGEVNRVTGAETGVRRLVQSMLAGRRAAPIMAPLLSSALQGPLLLRCGLSLDTETRREAIEMLPTMEIQGIPSLLAWHVLTAGSCCALLLVPGFVTFIAANSFDSSIGRLLAAMVLPGVILVALYMGVAGFIVIRLRNVTPLPKRGNRSLTVWRDLEGVVAKAVGVLLALTAILQGITTPTEAAAAIVIAMLYVAWLQRERPRPKDLRFAFEGAAKSAVELIFTVVAGTVLSVALVALHLHTYVSEGATALGNLAPFALLLVFPAALSALIGIPAALVLCGALVGQYASQSGLPAPVYVVLISYAVLIGASSKTMLSPPSGSIEFQGPYRHLVSVSLWSAPPVLVWVTIYIAPDIVALSDRLLGFH